MSATALAVVLAENKVHAAKAGAEMEPPDPVYLTIHGLRDDRAEESCLRAINRNRKRPLAFPGKGDGDYQIYIERKRPGFQVRIEKMGSALKTARALYDYEVCIAAAAIAREAIVDR
jgi:hypothetical protein